MPALSYSWSDPELWTYISPFDNYRISTWGRIFNIRHNNFVYPFAYNEDYPLRVRLRAHGETKTVLVHRLVAEAFLGGYRDIVRVQFVDDNKHNPHLLNLRFRGQMGMGQFLGGDEFIAVRKVVDEAGNLYDNVNQAAKALKCEPNAIYDIFYGFRRSVHGQEVHREWVEGSFDGDTFVPRPNEGFEGAEEW